MTRTRRILWALAALHAASGVAATLLPAQAGPHLPIDLLLGMGMLAAVYSGCRADATEHGRIAPGRSALWAALCPPVFLPAYFLRTRRPRAAALASLKALGVYLLLLATAVLAALLTALLLGPAPA